MLFCGRWQRHRIYIRFESIHTCFDLCSRRVTKRNVSKCTFPSVYSVVHTHFAMSHTRSIRPLDQIRWFEFWQHRREMGDARCEPYLEAERRCPHLSLLCNATRAIATQYVISFIKNRISNGHRCNNGTANFECMVSALTLITIPHHHSAVQQHVIILIFWFNVSVWCLVRGGTNHKIFEFKFEFPARYLFQHYTQFTVHNFIKLCGHVPD